MRIVVISDTHRRGDIAERILNQQPQAQEVFFLGDLTDDIEDVQYVFTDKRFHIVSGNCDFFSSYPCSGIVKIKDCSIFYTHGHTLDVKYGIERLKETAKAAGCKIALYGHTHSSQILYEDGIYIVNPGSCSQPRNGYASYAVIDIENNGIMPVIIKL